MIVRNIKKIAKCLYFRRSVILPRIRYAQSDIKNKTANNIIQPLSDKQKNKIELFWSKYRISHKIDYRWYDFFNTINPNEEHLEYYIPHDVYYGLIDTKLSNPIKAKHFDDKNLYDLIFHDIPQPCTVVRKENNIVLDNNYNIISIEDAINKCHAAKKIIIKPSIDSEGGAGISFWDSSTDSQELLLNILNSNGHYIFQEVAEQSSTLNQIHKNSLNTIRIMSLSIDNDIVILSSVLRMGINGSLVDNATAGGIFCGINEDGRLKSVAYDTLGKSISQHPQGGHFSNYVIPNFDKCKELIKKCAPRLHSISKLCSWDIYIDKNDNPALIEVNMTYGGVQLHQITNGPIFGSLTPIVLSSIFEKK